MSELLDNPAARVAALTKIIERLHQGASPERVRPDLARLVRSCEPSEIAAMEQQLIARGTPIEQIMGTSDLHAQATGETMVQSAHPAVPSGHPVDVFLRENTALRGTMDALRAALETGNRDEALARFNELMDLDKHYARKENLLFSCLKRHGITESSRVMWSKDDKVRALLGKLGESIACEDHCTCSARQAAERTLLAVEEMMFEEENVLLPMALSHLSESEWGEIHEQSPRFGWCLIDPAGSYMSPGQQARASGATARRAVNPDEALIQTQPDGTMVLAVSPGPRTGEELIPPASITFPTGSLSVEQLLAIFSTMPVDLTFVDADDRVRFFSEGPKRVFVRPRAVIGRKVQFCHPPSSVDTVNRILDDFKSDRQDTADFWIKRQGRFVQIRYFAVRNEAGTYLGTLEFTQDLTRERALDGERRLLQYD